MNYFTELVLLAVLAIVSIVLAGLLQANKRRILAAVNQVVQRVEGAIQGSGMGAEKKKLALTQLETMGIKLTAWVDEMIDVTVETLNVEGAWLIDNIRKAEDEE